MTRRKSVFLIFFLSLILISCTDVARKKEIVSEQKEPSDPSIYSSLDVKTTSFSSTILMDTIKENSELPIESTYISDTKDLYDGNFDIAIVDAPMAANLYKDSEVHIKIAGISLVNNLYLLSDGDINKFSDIFGKTIFVKDLGNDFRQKISKKIGLLQKFIGINIIYYKDADNLNRLIGSTKSFVALAREPYISIINDDKTYKKYKINEALSAISPDFDDSFDMISEVIIVNGDVLNSKEDALIKFLDEISQKKDSEPIISDRLVNTFDISKDDALEIYKNLDKVFIEGDTMKGIFNVLYDNIERLKLTSIFGQRPADDFYYVR
ncbi:hypothetical protein [Anaerococcus sp. AGMB09787]|uniref:hypothetical protein n=1 Tax=Anaerococcus sp. AGMB09787 TaxID=2922869 RepID=UPI001FAEBDBC|nr:hypothetical protein [Anaerococcus sp. AGMB09787]